MTVRRHLFGNARKKKEAARVPDLRRERQTIKMQEDNFMTYPKMIVFDYGHTLCYEPGFDPLSGERALFQYVAQNKNGLTPEQVNDYAQELFGALQEERQRGFEFHERQFQRLLYEYLEITLNISLFEAEKVFWNAAAPGEIMPGADKVLDYLNERGIRSGVISNIGFSGEALKERIDRLLPHNRFEFIIASSEYIFRKPSPLLFELALKKAGLSSGEVWFCGDNAAADVMGATSVGIFPVWYENQTLENPFQDKSGITPDCAHLHIHDWGELLAVLEKEKHEKAGKQ